MRILLLLCFTACATTSNKISLERQKVVKAALTLLHQQSLKVDDYTFDNNPVGFVRAVYWQADKRELLRSELLSAKNGMEVLYRSIASQGLLHGKKPQPGDLIFLNHPDEYVKHPAYVGIVEKVDKQETMAVIGLFSNGIRRVKINRQKPKDTSVNDSIHQISLGTLVRAFGKITS